MATQTLPLSYQQQQLQAQKDKLLGGTTTLPFYPTPTGAAPTITTPKTTTTPTATSSSLLQVGSKGDQVKAIQTKLGINADGIFGSQTQKAVMDYQRANGLTVDGIVGAQTLAKLNGGGGTGTTSVAPGGGNGTATTALSPQEELAQKAAGAGLSVSEYQALSQNAYAPTQEEIDGISRELGIPALEASAYARPSKTSQQLFDEAYATSGLGELKNKINALNEEITKQRAFATEAIGKIDENPFLSETSRVGRGRVVLDQAEKKLSNLIDQMTRVSDLYKTGVDEINNIVTRNQNDFNTNQSLDQAKLNYLLKKAENNVATLTQKKSGDTAKNASAFLGGTEPKLVGTSDTGYFKWDPVTKKYISVIGGNGGSGSTKMTAAEVKQENMNKVRTLFSPGYTLPDSQGVPFVDANGYATPQGWKTALAASGMSRQDFIKNFGDLVFRGNMQAYGLTPVEQKLIIGEIPSETTNSDE